MGRATQSNQQYSNNVHKPPHKPTTAFVKQRNLSLLPFLPFHSLPRPHLKEQKWGPGQVSSPTYSNLPQVYYELHCTKQLAEILLPYFSFVLWHYVQSLFMWKYICIDLNIKLLGKHEHSHNTSTNSHTQYHTRYLYTFHIPFPTSMYVHIITLQSTYVISRQMLSSVSKSGVT